MTTPPAGWYEDPDGTTRWWDGTQWTEHIQGPPQPPPAPMGGPTHLGYHPAPGQGMPPAQQPGYQPQQAQQPPWLPYAGGPGGPPKRSNTGLVLGIGGGVLVLVVIAIVVVLATRGGDSDNSAKDPLTPSSQPTTASPTPTLAPTPTMPTTPTPTAPGKKGWPPQLDPNSPDRQPNKVDAVKAPTTASVADFCAAENMILKLPEKDLHAYNAWFWYRIKIGTPPDMSTKARNGWVEDVAADTLFKDADQTAFENYEDDKCY